MNGQREAMRRTWKHIVRTCGEYELPVPGRGPRAGADGNVLHVKKQNLLETYFKELITIYVHRL